jgi:hypothetical protein
MAAVDSQETGSMDLLYVDLNRNLDLTDDKPFEVPMYSYYSQIEFAVDFVIGLCRLRGCQECGACCSRSPFDNVRPVCRINSPFRNQEFGAAYAAQQLVEGK